MSYFSVTSQLIFTNWSWGNFDNLRFYKKEKQWKKYRSTWGSVMESLFVRRSLLLVWTVNKIILFWLSTCAFDKHFLLLTCLNAMWADRVKSDKPECRVQTCTIHQITWCNNMASEVITCNRLQWTYFTASLCIQLTFVFFYRCSLHEKKWISP